ncbi:prepilin-type N-terminal cleavage/methylation domain-containing protein [Marinobacter sp. R17]|uniref:GspH/FimT family pseudopilin n=1 Tax=Marinobacter sp. R17 TaxID=2484250 RepID=UPI000F4C5ACC|nr:GspH/FimT family pseudopilin [Marinobacter sp. R17]ROU00671.1 prepilin-type N-terminal cleavage/methylation domain-containing protein [Marinobacter sp. R17]
MRKNRGFTLVELLVTLAVLAIVISIAAPSFSNMTANNRITSTTNTLVGMLNLARAEAVKRARVVQVSPVTGTNWSTGAVVWEDLNGDGTRQAGEIIRTDPLASGGVTISASAAIRFTGGGLSSTNPQIDICDDRSGETGRRVSISTGGRVRSEALTCS